MSYYIQASPEGATSIWKIDNVSATRIDVDASPIGNHSAGPGQDILAVLKHRFHGSIFDQLLLEPGEYHPCMARPSSSAPNETLGTNPDRSERALHARARSTGQLHALVEQLEQICRVVQPEKRNLDAYGHEIRNVLILACTEVEALWKGVLSANGAKGESTKDYVKFINRDEAERVFR
jgi:hypothetical protein